jgi:hypothetical protein
VFVYIPSQQNSQIANNRKTKIIKPNTTQRHKIKLKVQKKVKQSHYRPSETLRFQEGEAPRFQDNRHIKVERLSALHTGRPLYPQEIFLVLISVTG